jgi:hypothetical protein
LLVPKASGDNYSVEAGQADNVKHFDHHGKFSNFPAPCNNNEIPVIDPEDVVEITHIDADTLLGLARMAGKSLPKLDYDLIEKIDLNGSSAVDDVFNESFLYMVGVGEKAKQLSFPRAGAQPTDVTAYVKALLDEPAEKLIELGREATQKSEGTYKNNKIASNGTVGLWSIRAENPFDPSRPYADGIDVVVVYREHFKSISIYCSPASKFAFGNTTVADIPFAGHPKACGSPRGEEFTLDDAKRVYNELTTKTRTARYLEFRGAVYRKV